MCGIAGIWDPNNSLGSSPFELARITRKMTDSLVHRGPDGEGLWSDDLNRLQLGHRRLAIVDLSETGRQPMQSADQRWVITFNGEIYNHRPIREELLRIGCNFKGTSDTEVLVEGIARWGIEATVSKCRGMFAFAAWDQQKRELTFARDRVGEKPLYLALIAGALAFSSELKAFAFVPGWDAALNNDAIWDYLNFGYVCGDKSIYQEVFKIPPGSYVTLDLSAINGISIDQLRDLCRPYWTLTEKPRYFDFSDEEAISHFQSLFEQAIGEQLVADVPVGAFLSGGLDSSIVVALAARLSSRPVQTFTIGFSEDSYDESPWAKRIAAHLGTDHHELHLTEQDLLNTLPIMASVYDEPFSDPSQVPTYLVSRFARQTVKVALTGDGGDELFCGYNRYVQFSRANRLINRIPRNLRQTLGRTMRSIPISALDMTIRFGRFITGKNSPLQSPGARFHKLGRLMQLDSAEQRYQSLLSTGVQRSLLRMTESDTNLLHAPSSGGPVSEEDLMRQDLGGYLPDNGLVKLDRASMAISLEARAPFLDQTIVEHANRLPIHHKLRDGRGKWVLRSILSKNLPAGLFERPKAGFSVPVAAWLRGPLSDWLNDMLARDRVDRHGLLNSAAVALIVEQHQRGQADHGRLLWAMVMLESWLSAK